MQNFILSAFADEIDPSLTTQIETLKNENINYLELRGIDGTNVADFSLEFTREVKNILDFNGIKVSAIGSPIGKISILDDFDKEIERFLHIIDIAKILHTKYIRVFSFYIPEGHNPDIFEAEVMARLSKFIELIKHMDIVLLHENEKGIFGDNEVRTHKIMSSLYCDKFKATFDPANFIQCNVIPFPNAYNLLKPYIEYVHIKDATIKTGTCTPSGFGDGRIKDMLMDLKNSGFRGFLSIEPHLGYFEGFNSLELKSNVSCLSPGGIKSFFIATLALKNILLSLED